MTVKKKTKTTIFFNQVFYFVAWSDISTPQYDTEYNLGTRYMMKQILFFNNTYFTE